MKLIKKLNLRKDKNRMNRWGLFLCPYCNKIIEKRLNNGKCNKSCGCTKNMLISKANITYGDTINYKMTKLYTTWNCMKNRCYRSSDKDYKNYGGKGIKICDQWKNSYIDFKDWALAHGYKEGLTIDRINNNGNYEPSNCKFSTATEQAYNRKNTKLNWATVRLMRIMYEDGYTKKELFKIFDIAQNNLYRILNNTRWKEL